MENTVNKKMARDFEIRYEFVPSTENEIRIAGAYELVFEEIEKMLQSQERKNEYKANSILC